MTRVFPGVRAFALAVLCGLPSSSASATDSLTYLAHAPSPTSAHPPLIVLLHGAGADERDMISLWHDLPQDFVVVSPRAPFGGGSGYRWYRKAGANPVAGDLALSAKVLDLVVNHATQRFDADPKRIFLAGFSQGGVMVYQLALHEPGRFRGAAILSGSLFASQSTGLSNADRSHESVFIGHGTADPRIPFASAKAAQATLARLGLAVTFHAYAGMGHETGASEIRDLAGWLAQLEAKTADGPR